MSTRPIVTKTGVLDMQVCVPSGFTDEDIKSFADASNLCGTQSGWQIRRAGDKTLAGANERVECEERKGFVHVMLDA